MHHLNFTGFITAYINNKMKRSTSLNCRDIHSSVRSCVTLGLKLYLANESTTSIQHMLLLKALIMQSVIIKLFSTSTFKNQLDRSKKVLKQAEVAHNIKSQ